MFYTPELAYPAQATEDDKLAIAQQVNRITAKLPDGEYRADVHINAGTGHVVYRDAREMGITAKPYSRPHICIQPTYGVDIPFCARKLGTITVSRARLNCPKCGHLIIHHTGGVHVGNGETTPGWMPCDCGCDYYLEGPVTIHPPTF